MGIRELQQRYGGGNNRQVVNRAIRAEMVGGEDLLDAMPLVDRLAQRLRDHGVAGGREAQAALDNLIALRNLMAQLVLK